MDRKDTFRQRQRELNKTWRKAASDCVLRDLRVRLGHRADGMGERRVLGRYVSLSYMHFQKNIFNYCLKCRFGDSDG